MGAMLEMCAASETEAGVYDRCAFAPFTIYGDGHVSDPWSYPVNMGASLRPVVMYPNGEQRLIDNIYARFDVKVVEPLARN